MTVEISRRERLALADEGVRSRRWQRIWRTRNLVIGAVMLLVLVLIAVFAPAVAPYDPIEQDYNATQQPPSLTHLFGTDNFGRDIFSRVLFGTRIDLRVGIISTIPPFVIGIILGSLAAYYAGWIDTIVMRLVDTVQAFPFIVLIIGIVAVLGPGLTNMYFAVAIVAWIVYARLIRSEILVEKKKEYVIAAKSMGSSDWRIISKHLLPNTITSSIVFSMADIALYILLAASLSFLGLGAAAHTGVGRDDH